MGELDSTVIQELNNEKTMVRYLLGELPAQEGAQLEERCLSDDEFFEQMLAVENELIDNYLRGRLSSSEKERFERHFLASPQQREKVDFARTLLHAINQMPPASASAPTRQPSRLHTWWETLRDFFRVNNFGVGLAWVAAMLVIAVGAIWFARETSRLRERLTQSQEQQAALKRREQELQQQIAAARGDSEQLKGELERTRQQLEQLQAEANKPQQPALGLATFTLSLGAGRAIGEAKVLDIPANAAAVRLRVFLEIDEYPRYSAVLRTLDGKEIWQQSSLRSRSIGQAKAILLNIPAARFSNGDYLLTLNGIVPSGEGTTAGETYFTVQKK